MKNTAIGFILKGYPRVSETFIAQEIYLLEQQGFKIEILSMRKAREPERQPIVSLIQAPVTYVPEYIWQEFSTVAQENLKSFLRFPLRYLKYLSIASSRSLLQWDDSPIKRFLQAGWLVSKKNLGTQNSPIHHLHSHFAHTPTEMTWYMANIAGLRYSISAHAKDIYTISPKHLTERINGSELIMTCTSYNHEFMQKLPGVQHHKVHKVYHGINLNSFKPTVEKSYSRAELCRFVSVGRLVEKKGYDVIFTALQTLKQQGHEFSYDIFGSGELKKELLQLRDTLGLQNEIKFHYTATHPQIIERLNQGGIFICGSKLTESGDRDGIPNTVAEAMAMELPVVATNVSGIPELISHNEDGILIEEKDAQALTQVLTDLISNTDKARNLGKAARLKVARVFDSSNLIKNCATLLGPYK
ncbi:glycosyltransferase [Bdellovibrio svalbardensis]|uniref:Glycosyltransferase n=1 Tax=Bdellovibrio svalbardensis TaxID=2972972 RepID=A0ABT6DHE9_9BACT|nr:glycosyltransferase [Bdellovibrio svalbardensis]MDG0816280.1 glycosyltransferase [Bdellovibrio svalbardensis]